MRLVYKRPFTSEFRVEQKCYRHKKYFTPEVYDALEIELFPFPRKYIKNGFKTPRRNIDKKMF